MSTERKILFEPFLNAHSKLLGLNYEKVYDLAVLDLTQTQKTRMRKTIKSIRTKATKTSKFKPKSLPKFVNVQLKYTDEDGNPVSANFPELIREGTKFPTFGDLKTVLKTIIPSDKTISRVYKGGHTINETSTNIVANNSFIVMLT